MQVTEFLFSLTKTQSGNVTSDGNCITGHVSVSQEKQVKDKAEVFLTKVPQNIDELLLYTSEKIKQLTIINIIHKPKDERKFCVYCLSKGHNISSCSYMPQRSEVSKKSVRKKHVVHTVLKKQTTIVGI